MRQTAVLAVETRIGDPLDSHPVSYLDVLLRALSECNDYTSTFMTANEGQLGRRRPVTLQRVQV